MHVKHFNDACKTLPKDPGQFLLFWNRFTPANCKGGFSQ